MVDQKTTRRQLWRWVRLVAGTAAAMLALAALWVLPTAIPLLPRAIRGFPIEWLAVVLVAAFIAAHGLTRNRTTHDERAMRVRRILDRLDRGSGWLLDGGLTMTVLVLAAALLATWAPHYLTWPWCRDEDTFATLAQSWDAGIRPYRDIRAYNFPGHIYLHWLIGHAFGWGRTVAFYALDAAAVVALGVALGAWSRRRLGGSLPGLVGYVAFVGFYLGIDYESVAERDWHATLAAALAVMVLETVPGRLGLWIAAALEASALSIRPHAVLFLPAMASTFAERPRPWRAFVEWAIGLGLLTGMAFAPLWTQGLEDDLFRGLRVAAYGGPYSKLTPEGVADILVHELVTPWMIGLIGSLIWVWLSDRTMRRPVRTWLLALVAAVFYRTMHPVQHQYLAHPLGLISSIVLALPVARVLSISRLARPVRVLAVVLVLYEALPHVPTFCSPLDSIRALRPLVRGVAPDKPPPGCRNRRFHPDMCHYKWGDYCQALEYLRQTTRPETEIANVLREPPYPSLNGPAGRLSPFRAESGICWMCLIDIDLDAVFARALEETPDSVVVWSPAEDRSADPRLRLERVTAVIRRSYRPDARFGPIEVWRRSPEAMIGRTPTPGRPRSSGSAPPARERAAWR
jgi:hypothetical protein